MGTFANIVCKGVGIAGMSAVIYDSYSVAKSRSKKYAQMAEADHFEQIHQDTRSLSNVSYVGNAMQKKVADIRMNMPFASIGGRIKGFINGLLGSLADNFVLVGFSSLAIATKGKLSKIGAIGTAATALFTILKEGFGLTKKTPLS